MSPIDLLDDFKTFPDGLTLAWLLKKYPSIPRRTMQRWIRKLIVSGQLVTMGKARAKRYYLTNPVVSMDIFPSGIPLSMVGKDILNYVDKPLEKRKPIGYQPDFLQSYQPNDTFYLSLSLRNQLRKMGNIHPDMLAGGTYERTVLGRLLIDLSWASSHLEGNTYTLLDTRELIQHGIAAKGKAAFETQMILNHKSAIELLITNIDAINFNRYTIMNLHSTLSENLLSNPADEGRLRQGIVEITKSVYRPLAIPQQISEFFDLLLAKASHIHDPFEQAFFIMVHIPYLQPFIDLNKRTSRLAANIPLIRNNLCPLTFLGVTEQAYTRAILGIYELTRIELLRDLFIWAYERSTQEYIAIKQNIAEPDIFRLRYRDMIKRTVHDVVIELDKDALKIIEKVVNRNVSAVDRENVKALIIEELKHLHEGVLARYNLRPSDFLNWQQKHNTLK